MMKAPTTGANNQGGDRCVVALLGLWQISSLQPSLSPYVIDVHILTCLKLITHYSDKYAGITISLYCKKPGLNGGSKRQILVSAESEMFSLAAAARRCWIFFSDSAAVARPRNEVAIQISVSSSRKITCGSFGCGRWPNLVPDGITKETNHSSVLSACCAEITGAVIAIFCSDLLPLDMYLKSEPNAALAAVE